MPKLFQKMGSAPRWARTSPAVVVDGPDILPVFGPGYSVKAAEPENNYLLPVVHRRLRVLVPGSTGPVLEEWTSTSGHESYGGSRPLVVFSKRQAIGTLFSRHTTSSPLVWSCSGQPCRRLPLSSKYVSLVSAAKITSSSGPFRPVRFVRLPFGSPPWLCARVIPKTFYVRGGYVFLAVVPPGIPTGSFVLVATGSVRPSRGCMRSVGEVV